MNNEEPLLQLPQAFAVWPWGCYHKPHDSEVVEGRPFTTYTPHLLQGLQSFDISGTRTASANTRGRAIISTLPLTCYESAASICRAAGLRGRICSRVEQEMGIILAFNRLIRITQISHYRLTFYKLLAISPYLSFSVHNICLAQLDGRSLGLRTLSMAKYRCHQRVSDL